MKQLLFSVTKKDLVIQTFRSGGKGGQHQNKTDSGVRIIHKPSGSVGESRSERSQYRNKRLALKRLTAKKEFWLWVQRMTHEITSGKTIEQKVDEQMRGEIRVEVKEDGRWVPQ